MGLFDRYCSAENRIKFPELYKSSQNAQQFNVKVSMVTCLHDFFGKFDFK